MRLSPTMQTEVITLTGSDARPPTFSTEYARRAATQSPCQHSKRGVSVYKCLPGHGLPAHQELAQETWVDGCNGPPWEWDENMNPVTEGLCDGSAACIKDCARRCVHAEQRALFAIGPNLWSEPHLLRMVHVKINDKQEVVAGGGPRCPDCSKLLLDMGIGGIWLFESHDFADRHEEVWCYYSMDKFHEITCMNTAVHQVPP